MTFTTERRIEFRDTDAAGIAHFSVFFPMMEAAEHALLRSLGLSVMPRSDSDLPAVTWPRVAASCNYMAAARFEDVLTIDVTVAHIGRTSVRYDVVFRRGETLIAEGSVTSICCLMPHAEAAEPTSGLQKTAIPEVIRERLERHLADT